MEREESSAKRNGERMTPRAVLELLPAKHAVEATISRPRQDPLDALPDLSVGEEYEMQLARTGRAAVIDIEFSSVAARHHAYYQAICGRLSGRSEMISISDQRLVVDFQVEDDTAQSWAMIQSFADGLCEVLGDDVARVGLRINELDAGVVGFILNDERARLKAL